MAMRWFDGHTPVTRLPQRRQAFFDDVLRRIRVFDPSAEAEMRSWFEEWLHMVTVGGRDGVKVDDLGSDWTDTPFQAIYEVTEDIDES